MKKIFSIMMGVAIWLETAVVCAAEKFDILPDLPEPLAAAQASSVSTTDTSANTLNMAQSIGQEPNILSVVFSLIFVILLIYATGIIYTKLNKMGFRTLKKQLGETAASKVSVVSTTPLGSNKTLHVVELDGKRMLIGASSGSIQLLKDLGNYPPQEDEDVEYSSIEIPNIRIPKIEIPKIEFPNLGFTKTAKKHQKHQNGDVSLKEDNTNTEDNENDNFEISEIYEEGPDGIIDKLFQTSTETNVEVSASEENTAHRVDPDEYALYKKYL